MLHQAPAASAKLVRLVEGILAKNSPTGSPQNGEIPVDRVSLMLAVEAEFDLMIPTADITPQNFRSIAAIDALVARLGNGAVPSA